MSRVLVGRNIALVTATTAFLVLGADKVTDARPGEQEPIGLSLFFNDGTAKPIELVGDAPRYLQEIDLTARVVTGTDRGIEPLVSSSELADLDWRGVQFVEEDWRAPGDGTYTRQRFYRGARWMEADSAFLVLPKDRRGKLVGSPLVFLAGKDDLSARSGDGFVRRFVARQTTLGCAGVGDCSTATTFIAEGLVQSRQALNPARRAARIDARATSLELIWSAEPGARRSVALTRARPGDYPFGYGFQPEIELLTPPANGSFFLPGDSISFRLVFKDGSGRRLTAPGSLPTYAEFLSGTPAGGLRYLDTSLNVTLYYGLKHREGTMLFTLSGPNDALKTPSRVVDPAEFLGPQATLATVADDGFSAVGEMLPAFPVIFGGAQDPAIWNTPISDVRTLTLPADAKPGTYTAAIKARREWGGEALNRGASLAVQIGSPTPTEFTSSTGGCNGCHQGQTSLSVINHGLAARSTCASCHAALPFEPDAALDVRAHFVHSRSDRFPGDVNDCSHCHLSPPAGPARGFPGVPF